MGLTKIVEYSHTLEQLSQTYFPLWGTFSLGIMRKKKLETLRSERDLLCSKMLKACRTFRGCKVQQQGSTLDLSSEDLIRAKTAWNDSARKILIRRSSWVGTLWNAMNINCVRGAGTKWYEPSGPYWPPLCWSQFVSQNINNFLKDDFERSTAYWILHRQNSYSIIYIETELSLWPYVQFNTNRHS